MKRLLPVLLAGTIGCGSLGSFFTSDWGKVLAQVVIDELIGRRLGLEEGESDLLAQATQDVANNEATEDTWLSILFIGGREASEQALILYASEHGPEDVDEFTVSVLSFVQDDIVPALEEEADEVVLGYVSQFFDEALSEESASLLETVLSASLEFDSAGDYLGDRDEMRVRCILAGVLWGQGWEADAGSLGCSYLTPVE